MSAWRTSPLVQDELARSPGADACPRLPEGQLVIWNGGGPDWLTTVAGYAGAHDHPYLHLCVQLTGEGGRRPWVLRRETRVATTQDLVQVRGRTFAAWQQALWRQQLAAPWPIAPFRAAEIPALQAWWQEGYAPEHLVQMEARRLAGGRS